MKRDLAPPRFPVYELLVCRERGFSSELELEPFHNSRPSFVTRVARRLQPHAVRFVRSIGVFVLWIGLSLGSAVPVRAAETERIPAVDDKWRHYQSGNFELYSRNAEAESRELLQNLELLRAVCLERLGVVFTRRSESAPTFVLRSES